MTKEKAVLHSEAIQRKEFTYTLGDVSLKFTLRTDIKSELKAFRELASHAVEDIDAELEKIK